MYGERSAAERIRRGVIAVAMLVGVAPAPCAAQSAAPFAAEDRALVARAAAAANAGDIGGALLLRASLRDETARKLVTWYAYSRRDAAGDFADITAFLRANRHWPAPDMVAEAAERSITVRTGADALLAWFAAAPPRTAAGLKHAHAALKAQGKAQEADDLLRRGWVRAKLTEAEERDIVETLGATLRGEDHAARIGYLASHGRKPAALRLFHQLSLEPESRAIAEARLALRDEARRYDVAGVRSLLAKVAEAAKGQEDFAYDFWRWSRRGNRGADVAGILAALPATLADPERWWKEFDVLVRNAIGAGNPAAAYDLARQHRQRDGESYIEAEFLAGFIALRLLDKPDLAEKHFAATQAHQPHGWEAARTEYWLGRVAEAKGDKARAQLLYRGAAARATTFYGQVAAERLALPKLDFDPAATEKAAAERFAKDEIVRAAHLLRAAGDARTARMFALRAGQNGGWSAAQHAYLARFVLDLTQPAAREQTMVRLAKLAARDGAAVTGYGFPTLDLPEANTVEPALVFAVIRQESEFQAAAVSHAGARGLMQLMPMTAKMEATDNKLPYALARLTADPAYNLRLGTVHLQRLSTIYHGSYPLMAAAYNAGADRVDRWLAQHGDPRRGKTDWVDWIELIAFEETRFYTKYVLENLAIYRHRLGDKLEVAKLAQNWRAPKPDSDACKLIFARVTVVSPATIDSGGNGNGNGGNGAAGGKSSTAIDRDLDRMRAEANRSSADGEATEIKLLRKEKPDNRAGTPVC
jgi:soluble lytic murein transglycosylase